ncbi:MAG: hypothetical protein V2A77_09330 [Pseudomonadota bacterium]
MNDNDDDYQHEKPSWREIDHARDCGHRASKASPKGTRAKAEAERQRRSALAAAEKLFAGKKGGPEHPKALAALHNHYGTPKFLATARKYLNEYGPPDDWGSLILLLDYPDSSVVETALKRLEAFYPSAGLTKQLGLKAKIETLALVATNPDIRVLAEDVLSRLS